MSSPVFTYEEARECLDILRDAEQIKCDIDDAVRTNGHIWRVAGIILDEHDVQYLLRTRDVREEDVLYYPVQGFLEPIPCPRCGAGSEYTGGRNIVRCVNEDCVIETFDATEEPSEAGDSE